MKKLIMLTLVLLIGTATSFAQTFVEEVLSDVKLKDGKVYFYKMVYSDFVPCDTAGSRCEVKKDTTTYAEIYKIDPLLKNVQFSGENWRELYKVGFLKIMDNSGKKTAFMLSRKTKDSMTVPGDYSKLFFSRNFEHGFTPALDKNTGKIKAVLIKTIEYCPNWALFGYFFALISILYGLSNYKRYLFFKKYPDRYMQKYFWNLDEDVRKKRVLDPKFFVTGDLVMSIFSNIISIFLLVVSYLYSESIGLNKDILITFAGVMFILFGFKLYYKNRIKIWRHKLVFLIEFILITALFYWLSIDSNKGLEISWLWYYASIGIILLIMTSTRFYKKINNETIWETIKLPEFRWFISENLEKVRQKWVKFRMKKF